jgi:hypothetical protein
MPVANQKAARGPSPPSGKAPQQVPAIHTPSPVKDFIRRKGVARLSRKAIGLVRQLFPQLRTIELDVSRDPEERAEWLVLRVCAAAPRAQLTLAYRQYVSQWVRETPPHKRYLVRLSYTSV